MGAGDVAVLLECCLPSVDEALSSISSNDNITIVGS